ncbi:ribonuclease H family protein [Oryzibacter oryziterrae]|uniref:ribonuclease H family protein n=1 Tax=Oryzibacter oryziterrae TaxID=2766474 RepID=UPI001F37ECD6|nr:ribonuclease H [Oryzibacter oryziterrae]
MSLSAFLETADFIKTMANGASVEIYTDGAAEPSNPGPAGSGFVVVHEGVEVGHWSDHLGIATNNIAELTAAIRALEALDALNRTDLSVVIVSDSQYVVNGFTKWLPRWKVNGWRGANGKPVKNRELWDQLIDVAARFPKLGWRHVYGHSGNKWNDRADQLANAATLPIARAA